MGGDQQTFHTPPWPGKACRPGFWGVGLPTDMHESSDKSLGIDRWILNLFQCFTDAAQGSMNGSSFV